MGQGGTVTILVLTLAILAIVVYVVSVMEVKPFVTPSDGSDGVVDAMPMVVEVDDDILEQLDAPARHADDTC